MLSSLIARTSKTTSAPPAIDVRPSFERHRMAWAFGAGALAALGIGWLAQSLAAPARAVAAFAGSSANERPVQPIGGEEILADLAAVRAQQGRPALLAASNARALRPLSAAPPAQGPSVSIAQAAPASSARKRRRAAAPAPAPIDAAHLAYATLFGEPAQYQAGNALPRPRTADAHAAAHGEAQGAEGTLLPARLTTEVASLPAGGPVVAVLQRPVRLAGQLIPRGTEIHGTCKGSGNSDTRVFVQFELVRLSKGRSIAIRAEAIDLEGRHGVPGRKQLSARSAGSVGLSAATRVARAMGRQVAGSLGGALGAGLEGAAEASQQKAQRLDQDEYVVTVPRGTALQIYINKIVSPA